jgi:hypothetical protein
MLFCTFCARVQNYYKHSTPNLNLNIKLLTHGYTNGLLSELANHEEIIKHCRMH